MTWQRGDRVRVVLEGDPDALDANRGQQFPCGGRVFGHLPEQQDRTGAIDECSGGFPCRYGSAIGHGYLVRYDVGYPLAGGNAWGGHFAADELVRAD